MTASTEQVPEVPGTHTRQERLVPWSELQKHECRILGCGSVGRNIAFQLATMRVPKLHLVDFDTVEEANVGNQGYSSMWIGVRKVRALESDIMDVHSGTIIDPHDRRAAKVDFRARDVLFCAVDSMECRSQFYRWLCELKDHWSLFIDLRMAGELMECFTVLNPSEDNGKSLTAYQQTLYSDAEAYQGRCGTTGTIYVSQIGAGLAISRYAQWLRGWEPPTYTRLSLLDSHEYVV